MVATADVADFGHFAVEQLADVSSAEHGCVELLPVKIQGLRRFRLEHGITVIGGDSSEEARPESAPRGFGTGH
jgi:hypothetical protein